MKLINITKIGYNHPSGANWSYGIWKVDLIDTAQPYQMSYTVRENFGGEYRLKEQLTELKITHIESKAVYPSQKFVGIKETQNMENKEFVAELAEWYFKK